MKSLVLACALAGALMAHSTAAEPTMANTTAPSMAPQDRLLTTSIVIAAPASRLWGAFTDAAEYQRWAGGPAAVDLKTGGSFEASYDPHGRMGDPNNIRHRILAYVPERLIVFQNLASPGLPGEALYRGTAIVLQYEPLGKNSTRVTVSHIGLGSGPAYDPLFAFFQRGDARMLQTMKTAYEGMR